MKNSLRIRLLRIILALGSLFYIVGAIAHYFGLTIFPWYDGALYQPYHDSLIAVAGVVIAMILAVIAEHPVRNKEMIKVVIAGALLAGIFSIAIIWKIDFDAIGASAKKTQTIFEGFLGFAFAGVLWWLYPRGKN